MHKTAVIAVFVSASLAYAAIAQAQGSAGDAGTSKPKASQGKAGAAKEEKASAAKEVKTASGLTYTELKAGTGPSPSASDTVKVNYRGTLTDGKEFDSSYKRGQPAEFQLNRVIPCWTEGVQKMKAGGKAKLVCPASIAYGDRGAAGVIPPGATLIFEIELISVQK